MFLKAARHLAAFFYNFFLGVDIFEVPIKSNQIIQKETDSTSSFQS